MIAIKPELIPRIDKICEEKLNISPRALMKRAAEAVERVLRERVKTGARVVILCGCGNNGGDGYAVASSIIDEYDVTVFDVFGKGQRSNEGTFFLKMYKEKGGKVCSIGDDDSLESAVMSADALIDAVFGTGYKPSVSEVAKRLASAINSATKPFKLAIDVPLGCDADLGAVNREIAVRFDVTVLLAFLKRGLLSYPAAHYAGELIFDNIGLQKEWFLEDFDLCDRFVDAEYARELLPKRAADSHKGSYGKIMHVTGSAEYQGASMLALGGALRSGAGYVHVFCDSAQQSTLLSVFPEALYELRPNVYELKAGDIERLCASSRASDVTLIGCGLGRSGELYSLVEKLLLSEGGALVLDADALNVISENSRGLFALEKSRRKVVITPHPLEFSRLIGRSVSDVQENRILYSVEFAKKYGCTVLLKGARTVITDGERVFINSSGSSALAKAGSGDVLAGIISAFTSYGDDITAMAALAAYLHGRAADSLACEYSDFSVIPSDIPLQLGREIVKLSSE